jgi:sugar phosphate isomerase/epimerase
MERTTRRTFVGRSAGAVAAALGVGAMPGPRAIRADDAAGDGGRAGREGAIRFGLVTYLWGAEWDLPALIANCEKAGIGGVELRTTHRHGVEPSIDAAARGAVKERFAASRVALVGLGSNERFDSPDPKALDAAVEATKAFLRLSRDVCSGGVKVKPDSFHEGVPREKTIEQIGAALRGLGPVAADLDQELRLEVHGKCARLETIKAIMDVADHSSVRVCWNSNAEDLAGRGLEHNFGLVRDRLGKTVHVHEHGRGGYPYADLVRLLVAAEWDGWLLLEASGKPADPVAALIKEREAFEGLVAAARKARAKR